MSSFPTIFHKLFWCRNETDQNARSGSENLNLCHSALDFRQQVPEVNAQKLKDQCTYNSFLCSVQHTAVIL